MHHRPRVAVIRGGQSAEYDVSLASGAAVLAALREKLDDKYHVRDVLIDRDGLWHMEGKRFEPENSYIHFDLAINALHGTFGEDGKIQSFFETHGMPFTGSGSLASAVGMNKILTKNVLKRHGIKSPYHVEVGSAEVRDDAAGAAHRTFSSFVMPAVVKPADNGSSVGVSVAGTEAELGQALTIAARYGDVVIVEEHIPGVEATCGVIEGFRGQELYALPPVEIRPANRFFDYEAKYQGRSEEIVPATFSNELKEEIEELARNVHSLLGLRHYSRTDFIIHPRRGIYVLETNTLPGLTPESIMPKALMAVGSGLHHFVDHLIELAMRPTDQRSTR